MMNRISRDVLVAILAVVGFITILGYAGSYEWAEQVCYTMPEEAYYSILDTLGDDASQKDIAEEYMSKKEYYDNLEY